MALGLSTTLRVADLESTISYVIGFSPDGRGGVIETHYAEGKPVARYLVYQRPRPLTGKQRTRRLWRKRGRR